jgi:hypothetical protein
MHKPVDNNKEETEARKVFICKMLKLMPETNFCNFQTGWRPVNWLAAHGDRELVELIIKENNA